MVTSSQSQGEQAMESTFPGKLFEEAAAFIVSLNQRQEGWDGTAMRLDNGLNAWVSAHDVPFDKEEFLFLVPLQVEGKSYYLYHGPRTGKYDT